MNHKSKPQILSSLPLSLFDFFVKFSSFYIPLFPDLSISNSGQGVKSVQSFCYLEAIVVERLHGSHLILTLSTSHV
jgi:hypothetical protein